MHHVYGIPDDAVANRNKKKRECSDDVLYIWVLRTTNLFSWFFILASDKVPENIVKHSKLNFDSTIHNKSQLLSVKGSSAVHKLWLILKKLFPFFFFSFFFSDHEFSKKKKKKKKKKCYTKL